MRGLKTPFVTSHMMISIWLTEDILENEENSCGATIHYRPGKKRHPLDSRFHLRHIQRNAKIGSLENELKASLL